MAGLQTSHRYGNATLLASDFVLGIGNRWANRHTGGLETYTQRPHIRARGHRAHADRPRVRPGLRHRVRRQGGARAARRSRPGSAARPASWRTAAAGPPMRRARSGPCMRKTHFDDVPVKPQRVYEEMNRVVRQGRALCQHDRPVADRRRAVPARLQAAPLDQLRPGRPAGLDRARGARRGRGRSRAHGRRAFRRLRLPVHDRGTGRRRAVQPAVRPRAGEQLLPRA